MNAQQLQSLHPALAQWVNIFEPCFRKDVTFKHFQSYLMGLLADLRRKSVEPIALASGTPVRTMQEFLSMFRWDHQRMDRMLRLRVADRFAAGGIGVIDATGHPKRGDKTPGVQRQYCGESGKIDNCVVAQHLLFTDNEGSNPFSCVIASDLYLPKAWADDADRRQEAGIPPEMTYRPKWKIALQQVRDALADGVKLNYVVFDEDYGRIPAFWFGLDARGIIGVGEVPSDFRAWVKRPHCRSGQAAHAARRVGNLLTHSPAFTQQSWKRCVVKDTTRGKLVWEYKSQRVHLSDSSHADHNVSTPTDRMYWLIVMRHPTTGEIKYVVSNATEGACAQNLIRVLLSRWHVEKWFERAKQDAGLGAFEVRTYVSLIRHWLCVRIAMTFLAEQTARLRGEKPETDLRTGDRSDIDPGQQMVAKTLAGLVGIDASLQLLPAT